MDAGKEIKAVYGAWEISGKTQREFCAENGVKMGWFKYHVLEGRKSGALPRSNRGEKKETGGAFAAVRVTEANAAYCENLFNGKLGVRIESSESLGQLKQLIESLA